jgi:metal-responsive CopG/Arc/MetJ family transcriptional regulator
MNGLSRETRLQIMLDEDELAAIDDWRFKRRMPSRAAAIRELLRRGLQAELGKDTDRSRRSEDFGVIGRDSEAES